MNKNKIFKIAVPLCMLMIVGAIWIFSNSSKSDVDTLNLTSVNLEELQSENLPIIIDFGADSCIPCKEMAPVLVKLNTEYLDEAVIKFVDVWKYPEASYGFPVQVIPTQIFINADGTPYVPSEDLGVEFIMYADVNTEEHIFTAHQGGLTETEMTLILEDMGV